ncbi:MAG: hydrogenase expression/formation protein HypE [Deltaproteobacteria bacterium]|nr:hydrogenase expression/formation protein HypE [Deltaproteobacteria bacterium]MBW2153466.1 hydrogenase expression/formation protein HypE [Deltaproteobacteria bacterium]
MEETKDFQPTCPMPFKQYPKILLSHGGGGTLMHQLIEDMFLASFGNSIINARDDAAVLEGLSSRIAYTTDSYVVQPIFFPGGDIGSLAVNGTVNDLAMSGARPLFLTAGFILEEGLDMEVLWRVVKSMTRAAKKAGVSIVAGDTKVVDKGKGDGIYINTSGIGFIEHDQRISPRMVQNGDVLILSGDIGRHGIAVMAIREGLEFESDIKSDCAPLVHMVADMIAGGIELHCMRDLTRGGLAGALNEIAENSQKAIHIDQCSIPVQDDVSAACEMLGFDPLYVANEGKFIAFVPEKDARHAVNILKQHPQGREASIIGEVKDRDKGIVTMKTRIGTTRIVGMLSGEQLPRIC